MRRDYGIVDAIVVVILVVLAIYVIKALVG